MRAFIDLTFPDHNTSFASEESYGDYLAGYYGATKRGVANSSYNCHSYAWYSTSPYNRYWIDSPLAYMNDGSYIPSPTILNAKVVYCVAEGLNSGLITHSAIRLETFRAVSKWGCMGVYEHDIAFCPYDDWTQNYDLDKHTTVSYWQYNYN